jgi:SagB-type dehydrogenase family enzyme
MSSMHAIVENSALAIHTGGQFVCMLAVVLILILPTTPINSPPECGAGEPAKLPEPVREGKMSVEKAILERRSVREFQDAHLTLAEISQLLWVVQGITSPQGYRTVPSAGALYPLEVFVLAGKVEGLAIGVYRYRAQTHELTKIADGDRRFELSEAALGQAAVRRASAVIVISGVFERTTRKYGERGIRYVYMESGNASQNVSLEAVSLGLGTVIIGAFHDKTVKKLVGMDSEEPLIIMPVGKPAR